MRRQDKLHRLINLANTSHIQSFLHFSPLRIKEENVEIYRRYIMYREGSTRYFVEKNRMREIYAKIANIMEKKWPKMMKIADISIGQRAIVLSIFIFFLCC